MDLFDVIRARRSIRAFQNRPVEPHKLQAILEAANAAPSAANLQCYEIYVVTDVRQRSALARAAGAQGFVLAAPVSLVFCSNPKRTEERLGKRGKTLYPIQDATIAATFAILAAAALGLGTAWAGSLDPDAVRDVIGAPQCETPLVVLPIGYAAEQPEPKERRSLDDLVHRL